MPVPRNSIFINRGLLPGATELSEQSQAFQDHHIEICLQATTDLGLTPHEWPILLFLFMSVRLLSGIKLPLFPHLFQPLAHNYLNAGHYGLIVRVEQLQAQASDILIVSALAHHLVGKDLFATP